MTKPCQFSLRWGGRSLDIRADLSDAVECDRLIRAIEANRWLLAPDASPEPIPKFINGDGLTRSNLAHAETAPASPPKVPDSTLVVTHPPGGSPEQTDGQHDVGALTAVGSRIAGPTSPAKPRADEVREIIATMWPTRVSLNDICAAAGISKTTLRKLSRGMGLPLREAQLRAKAVDRLANFRKQRETVSSGESRERQTPETPATMPASEGSKPEAPPEERTAPMQPPGTAATFAPASHFPELINRPENNAPTTNGHAPAGKLVVSTNGILLHEYAIVHGDRSIDISAMECRALTVVLRASPNPVGVPFILKRGWPHINQAVAESQLTHACKRLRDRLPEIGLKLHTEKGVGIAIGVAA